MSGVIAFLLGPDGIFVWLGVVVAAVLGWTMKTGRDLEKGKQARERERARDISDEVENDVGAMTPEQREKELKRWSRD